MPSLVRVTKKPPPALYVHKHSFATRLSAGGVADHIVTEMLRQEGTEVFGLYSQGKARYDA